MSPEKRIKLAIGLVVVFLLGGTAGYVFIDNYSVLDAFYMTVITITTVGYGEIQQLSELGRMFTIVLILLSVGSIALLAGAFSELLIERAANPTRWKKKMEKKIEKLNHHVIICGHGRVGASAAEFFHLNKSPFVVIENEEEAVKEIDELGYHFVRGDGTREEMLLKANIKKASAVLAVMDSDPENLFAVLTARELNPVLRIIARTESISSESRLLRAGADSVISPYVAAGHKVAKGLMTNSEIGDGSGQIERAQKIIPHWFQVDQKSGIAGKTIKEIAMILNTQILGYRRDGLDCLMPTGEESIELDDTVLILTQGEGNTDSESQVTEKKIILIDDNPVIIRLYTRLFQKAGYTVHSASTGEQGYELILREQPDVAVIDFHLPDMSGVDVCKKLKEIKFKNKPKICLFTADEQGSTKEKAKEAGADKVVIKSPEADEVVKQVESLLD